MVLSLNAIAKSYDSGRHTVTAVRDVSLTIQSGEFVAITGPSGCGKSTLLMMAGGLLSPNAGTVNVDATDLYSLSANDRAKYRNANVGFVFQQLHLVPYLSVLNNVRSPALVSGVAATDRAMELLKEFGLSGRLNHKPGKLSVGERQRAALARAMLNKPKLLLADEPTGNLDAENSQVVLNHMRSFADSGGAVLLVTHDPVAAEKADRTVPMRDGQIEAGATSIA